MLEYKRPGPKVRLGALHDVVNLDNVTLEKEPTDTNVADTFTKPLDKVPFERHRDNLQLRPLGVA